MRDADNVILPCQHVQPNLPTRAEQTRDSDTESEIEEMESPSEEERPKIIIDSRNPPRFGMKFFKYFEGRGTNPGDHYEGTVVVDRPSQTTHTDPISKSKSTLMTWRVRYQDGDYEDLTLDELKKCRINILPSLEDTLPPGDHSFPCINDSLVHLFTTVASSVDSMADAELSKASGPMTIMQTEQFLTDARVRASSRKSLAKTLLWEAGFQPAMNAFVESCIEFGLDPRGLWGANPTDLMHAFQSGIVRYIVKMAIDPLPLKAKKDLDALVERLFSSLRSTEKEDYPRLNFSKGFCKVTNINSDEWPGKLFVLLIVARHPEGKLIFKDVFQPGQISDKLPLVDLLDSIDAALSYQDKGLILDDEQREKSRSEAAAEKVKLAKEALAEIAKVTSEAANPNPSKEGQAVGKGSGKKRKRKQKKPKKNSQGEDDEFSLRQCGLGDFVQLAEALLSFHSWYKRSDYSQLREESINDIHESMCRLLAMVKYFMPRRAGNGWKLQKYHDMLHLAENISRFGSPKNFDCGPGESSLRYWAKLPALTAQTRGYDTFSQQVANRIHEM